MVGGNNDISCLEEEEKKEEPIYVRVRKLGVERVKVLFPSVQEFQPWSFQVSFDCYLHDIDKFLNFFPFLFQLDMYDYSGVLKRKMILMYDYSTSAYCTTLEKPFILHAGSYSEASLCFKIP